MRRGTSTSPLGTPSLIGAVTVLISITAVFLAYNANKGLPFVPTYNLSAQIPGGANLVEGNDVRVGGFQVGIVGGATDCFFHGALNFVRLSYNFVFRAVVHEMAP